MTKKALSLLLALVMVCGTMCALPMTSSAADSETRGVSLPWTYNNGTLTISGTGDMEDYYLMDTDDKKMAPWQKHAKSITSVIINKGVTGIGKYAFNYCTSLKSVTIPNSVTTIGQSAFNGCESLTSVSIPNSVASVGDWAFGNCTALKSVTIPNSVTSIGASAFDDCISLTSISIPNSVTEIEYGVFYGCTSLKSVTIPNSVTRIGWDAFYGCTSLTNITIPNSVTNIGYSTFECCSSLTSITIPNSVTYIGGGAFARCSSLTSVEVQAENAEYTSTDGILFSKDKTEILCYPAGKSATDYTIPGSVTTIGHCAFRGCTVLKSITIPNSVTTIYSNAFSYCTSLTSITIPNSVTDIGSNTFDNCTSLSSVTISDSVTDIGIAVFEDCTSLKSVNIPNSVTTIRSSAFSGCTSLKSVNIPNSVTEIGGWAFDDCTSLLSITIPDSVTTIKDYAFNDCTSLVRVIISDSVTSIENNAFADCNRCTIYGHAGSYAQTFATENKVRFVAGTTVGNTFFIDVVPDEWYVSAVQYAVDNKLFFGVSDCEFAPNEAMNRAMLVTVLWRLEGKPTVSAENTFTDVPAGEWYTNAVIWASENGVVYGTGNGKFSPDDSITREQMATILYRYAKNKGYDVTASTDLNTFPDGGNASSYARTALSWACGAGLIFGSEGKLLPQDGATRAQVAAILMRYTKKVVQK